MQVRGEPVAALTDRERQVLHRISLGWPDKRIAASLDITVATVRSHVSKILQVGRFGNRWEAAAWGLRHKEAVWKPGHLVPYDVDGQPKAA